MERSERVQKHEEELRMSPRKPTRVPLTNSVEDLVIMDSAGGREALRSETTPRRPSPRARPALLSPEQKAENARREAERAAKAQRKEERMRARQERDARQKAKRRAKREKIRLARAKKREREQEEERQRQAAAEAAASRRDRPAANAEPAAAAAPTTAAGREVAKRAEDWRVLLEDLEIPAAMAAKLVEFRIKVSDLPDITDDELAELVPDPASCKKLRWLANQHLRSD